MCLLARLYLFFEDVTVWVLCLFFDQLVCSFCYSLVLRRPCVQTQCCLRDHRLLTGHWDGGTVGLGHPGVPHMGPGNNCVPWQEQPQWGTPPRSGPPCLPSWVLRWVLPCFLGHQQTPCEDGLGSPCMGLILMRVTLGIQPPRGWKATWRGASHAQVPPGLPAGNSPMRQPERD